MIFNIDPQRFARCLLEKEVIRERHDLAHVLLVMYQGKISIISYLGAIDRPSRPIVRTSLEFFAERYEVFDVAGIRLIVPGTSFPHKYHDRQ